MASYEKPTEDLPIFNPSVFVDENEALTIATGSRYFLRYPFAQGTENLQDTNVNGLLTTNGDIDITLNSEIKWDNILNNYLINQRLPKLITTGGRNISLGHSALHDIDTGNDNIAFGFDAGSKITSASSNQCIGTRAGENITTSSHNLLIGTNAGQNITTAYNNIGLGNNTLSSLTTNLAFSNIAIGRLNLNSLSGASDDNCAIGGIDVMRNLPSGLANIGIGTAVWRDRNTVMDNNVAIGYQSNMTQLAGDNNTALGTQTSNGGFSDSTCIGYQAQNTANNQIRLGRATENVSCPGTLTFRMSDDNTAGTYFIPFSKVSAGTEGQLFIDSTTGPLTYNPSTATLTCAYTNLSQGIVNPDTTGNRYVWTDRTTRPTGTGVILIGYRAGNLLSTGDASVMIGTDVGRQATSGNNNVYVGHQVAEGSNASNCTFIGYRSNQTNTPGANCTAIGANTSCATFQNCTAIGQGATCTANNQIRLGTASETVSCPNIIQSPRYDAPSATTLVDYAKTSTTANITLGEALTSGNILIGPQASGSPSSNVTIMPRGGWNGVFQVGGNSANAKLLCATNLEVNYPISTSNTTAPTLTRQLGFTSTKTTGWTATFTNTAVNLNTFAIDGSTIDFGVYTVDIYLNIDMTVVGASVQLGVSTTSATFQAPTIKHWTGNNQTSGVFFSRTISSYTNTTWYVVGQLSAAGTATLDTAGTDGCSIVLTRIA